MHRSTSEASTQPDQSDAQAYIYAKSKSLQEAVAPMNGSHSNGDFLKMCDSKIHQPSNYMDKQDHIELNRKLAMLSVQGKHFRRKITHTFVFMTIVKLIRCRFISLKLKYSGSYVFGALPLRLEQFLNGFSLFNWPTITYKFMKTIKS